MTAPGGGGADEIREQLAEALPESLGPVGLRRPAIPALDVQGSVTGYGVALLDALLPTVQALIAENAAAELRAAADWLTGSGPNGSLPGGCAPDQTSDGLSWMEDVEDRDSALDWCQMSLRDRADALDGTP